MAMSRRIAGTRVTSWSPMRMVPALGGSSPAIMLQRGGLAAARRAEEGHELAVARSARSIASTAVVAPKRFDRPARVTDAIVQPLTAPAVRPRTR